MARKNEVLVTITKTVVTNEEGRPQNGIEARCSHCEHKVTCYGQGLPSERRACMLMREECPEGVENWYTTENLKEEG